MLIHNPKRETPVEGGGGVGWGALKCGCGCGTQKAQKSADAPHFSIHSFRSIRFFLPFNSFILHATEIGAEMGVDPVEYLPVEASASPVEVAVLEPRHAITDHVARKPAGGRETRHRRFEPGWVREEGFVCGAEDGTGHVGEMCEEVRVAGWWRWLAGRCLTFVADLIVVVVRGGGWRLVGVPLS